MAAPMFRLILTNSRQNKLIHLRYAILMNSLKPLIIQTANNHNQYRQSRKSSFKNFLTYKQAIAGALVSGFGYTLYNWENVSDELFNNKIPRLPTVFAKSDSHKDISQNRKNYNFIADVVEVSAPAVVYIEIEDQRRVDFFTGKSVTTGNGSGFIVSEDGLILTNAHVVINKPNTLVKVKLQDGTSYVGKVEDVDLQSDLATIRIDKNSLPVMKLGSSANIRPGEFVVAIGSPLTLNNTITSGVISSVNRQSEELGLHHKRMGYLQTDAAITFGNSGGPLVNLSGEAIGINAMKVTAGISFAIPIDYAKEFLKKAEQRRKTKTNVTGIKNIDEHPRRRYMGITTLSLTPDILFELQQHIGIIPSNVMHGVFVWKVNIHSPAYIGGLKAGDIITHVNDTPVKQTSDIYTLLEKSEYMMLTVVRGGENLKIRIDPE